MKVRSLVVPVLVFLSSLFAGLANAVTVSVVPGKSVGLGDAGYWAGVVTLNIDGMEYPAMVDNFVWAQIQNPSEITEPWNAKLLSQNEIETGTVSVFYAPERYRIASQLFLYAMLGYYTDDPLWTAGHNEMVWDVLLLTMWEYGDRVYDPQTGITMHDVYLYNYLANGLDPAYDYSGFMHILQQPDGGGVSEFLVYTGGAPIVPVLPAVWLFGSGLIGLIAAARPHAA
ncbi:MAG TPA: hypothetical protein ENJ79_07740 [Gammaproteobacteria bacterium]|nr:hypothetical protein [Gammaproteobacteria bacterium]